MALTTATAGPLVAPSEGAAQHGQWVRVTRAFCLRGEPQAVAAEMQLDRRLAVELAAAGKGQLLDGPTQKPRKAQAAPPPAQE